MCLTRMYVVIVCDGCIILGGVLGTQNRLVLIFFVIEGTDLCADLIAEKKKNSEDELTGALIDEVKSWG